MTVLIPIAGKSPPTRGANYITNPEKTKDTLIDAYGCDPEHFGDDMIETQKIWGKTNGRRYYHFILSPDPDDKITPAQMKDLTFEYGMSEFGSKGFEFGLAVHTNTDKVHAHIIVNAVNAEDGKKWHSTRYDYKKMRERLDKLCEQYSISKLPPEKEKGRNRTNGEYWLERKGIDSFKKELCDVIDGVRQKAKSYDEFKRILHQDWNIEVTRDTGKGMTYIHPDGQHVRGKKLGPDYDKPALLEAFNDEHKIDLTQKITMQQPKQQKQPGRRYLQPRQQRDRNRNRGD